MMCLWASYQQVIYGGQTGQFLVFQSTLLITLPPSDIRILDLISETMLSRVRYRDLFTF
jgi:hypothetical protein